MPDYIRRETLRDAFTPSGLFLRQVSSVRRSAVFQMVAVTPLNYRPQALARIENCLTWSMSDT